MAGDNACRARRAGPLTSYWCVCLENLETSVRICSGYKMWIYRLSGTGFPHLFQYVETLLNQNIFAYHHILMKENKDVPVRALKVCRGRRDTTPLILKLGTVWT